jgi:hypothetical protein
MEPWYGVADETGSNHDLTEKPGIMKLAAGGEFKCRYSLSFG